MKREITDYCYDIHLVDLLIVHKINLNYLIIIVGMLKNQYNKNLNKMYSLNL